MMNDRPGLPNLAWVSHVLYLLDGFLVRRLCALSFLRKPGIIFCFIGWWIHFTFSVLNLILFIPGIYHLFFLAQRCAVLLVVHWTSLSSNPSLPWTDEYLLLVVGYTKECLTTFTSKNKLKYTHTYCNINLSKGLMWNLSISDIFPSLHNTAVNTGRMRQSSPDSILCLNVCQGLFCPRCVLCMYDRQLNASLQSRLCM